MQTIQIEVNDNYLSSVLTILNSIKDDMIQKIQIDNHKKDNINDVDLQSLQLDPMSHLWSNVDDEAWNNH